MSQRADAADPLSANEADTRNPDEMENEHPHGFPGLDIQQVRRRANRPRSVDREVEPQLATLLRIEALLTLLAKRSIQPLLEQELIDPTARKIYEATGNKTVREIAEETGVGIGTVSRTWSRWEGLGIVTKEGTRYRRVV